ncbi:MAG: transglycosylase [Bacteroidota bacterium]
MKIVSIVLIILGIIGLIVFGMQAMNDSESFSLLGAEVAVSKANWTPVIVSGAVLIIGVFLLMVKKK